MKHTQLPTNDNIHVFWSIDSTKDTVIVEIGNNLIDFHQKGDWVTIPREVLIKIANLIKKK